jgi:hypothetical protein
VSRLKLKPQGKCIFCGGIGLCKGHIWPDWLKKEMPEHAAYQYHIQTLGEFLTFSPKTAQPKKVMPRQGHARSRKIKATCEICDNGWMSRLEQTAKAVAMPLIRGKPTILNEHQQELLASWLCLMTIMVEHSHPSTAAIPADVRKWFMEHLKPHQTFRISIGCYDGTNAAQHWTRHVAMPIFLEPPKSGDSVDANSQATTIVIGKLCAHVLSSPFIADLPRYTNIVLHQIWPVTNANITWPGLSSLTDAQVISLAEAIAAGGIQL